MLSLLKKKKLNKFIEIWIFPSLWMGLIFFFSSRSVLPSLHLSFYDFIFKKSAHMFVYAVLYWLFYRSVFRKNHGKIQNYHFYLILFFCLIYAFSDEYHQSFVEGRTAKLGDVGYDFLGMLTVFLKLKNFI